MQRALMLTPDEGHLDRRIAQEAGSLAENGWSVDIFPAVDPALRFDGMLADGVALLASPHTPAPTRRSRALLRAARRRAAAVLPALDRAVEAFRYRGWNRAEQIDEGNRSHLLALGHYDLVVAHDVPVFPLAAALATAWDAALVCDLHEIFPEQDEHFTSESARDYWRRVEAIGMAASNGILCVNDAVADYVRDRYAPSVPIAVVHNSVPFVGRAELAGPTLHDLYPIPEGRRVMVFAGSMRPYANLETVIAGFGRARLDGWSLALLGDGPLKARLASLIQRLRLDRHVHVGARAAERDLISVIASADCGVLPYEAVGINHEIATPNKLFEYIQARVPIATSRLPMIERIVGGAGIGGFVDYSSPDATARDLVRFVDETLPGVTPAELDAAAERFSWEREEGSVLELVAAATRRAAD